MFKSVFPVPPTSKKAILTFPINASPYKVPAVTGQGEVNGKSTHANDLPTVTLPDSLSKLVAVGEFELVAYMPAVAGPEVPPYPSTYA